MSPLRNFRGKAIIISAPSGAGKTTLVKRLLKTPLPLKFSISACSRNPRANEKNTDTIFCKPFTDYNIFDIKTLKNYIATTSNPFFKKIPIEQLFQDLIIAKKRYINPSVVYSKEFNSQLLLSRHTIKRYLKDKEYIFLQIGDETSIKNVIYYILDNFIIN